MAHRVVIRALRVWAQAPIVLRIGVIYLAARAVTTAFLMLAGSLSTSLSRYGADAGITEFVLGWDAQWYWWIAVNGYPTDLPLTEAGHVAENAWAFMPLYAYAAQALGFLVGSWGAGALALSLIAGFLACLALYRLLRRRIGSSAALWAVAFFAAGPLGALFQVGYAESLFLLLLFLALDAVAQRRFGRLYILLPVMAFTRPGILAFALFVGLYGILRWVRRRYDPLPVRHIVHIVALGALATITGFAWPVIVSLATGDPGGYLSTELAWRRHWIAGGVDGFVPFEGWVQGARFWFEYWGMAAWMGPLVLLLLIVAMGFALCALPQVRALGPELRLWSLSYVGYLLAVFFPQSSTLRLLIPLSPLWGALAVPRSRLWRVGVLAVGLFGQWLWIYHVYALGNAFWHVP